MSNQRHENIKNTAIRKFQAYCRHCTLHGFCYFSERRHWMVYLTWSTIIASSIALCAFLSHMIWEKFVVDPTFTVVESTHYSTTRITFPAVTICDTEKIYGPNTYNITNILQHRSYTQKQIEAFYTSFSGVENKDYSPPDYLRKMHRILHELGYTMDVLLQMLAKPCDVMMVSCSWRSRLHDCKNMFRQVYTYVGYCCTFDMTYFIEHAAPDTDFTSGIETTEALTIVVNGQKVSFQNVTTTGYVLLYVYDDQTTITLMDPATILTPAGIFDVNVFLWAIDSSKDVKTLSLESRKCILDTDHPSTGRTYQECMSTLIMRQVVTYCRCLPFHYTAAKLHSDDYGICTWDRLTCVYQTIGTVKSNIADIVEQNECLQQCDRVEYETEIETIPQQRKYREMDHHFSNVVIHYRSNTCLKYRREVLYAWDQMLANLGGIFGLCLGGSIISLIELIWFIIEFLNTIFLSSRKRSTGPVKKKLVFTISQQHLVAKAPKEKIVTHKFVH